MDEGCNKAVNHVFKKLYDKGLIYRGERIINWCPVSYTHLVFNAANLVANLHGGK